MKKLLLLTASLVFIVLNTWAQSFNMHISGTVTELNSNIPIANQTVTIVSDSIFGTTFNYYNQVTTDSLGFYEDNLYVPTNLQIVFYISVIDCQGFAHVQTGLNTNSPILADFSICHNTPPPCNANFTFAVNTATNLVEFTDLSTGNPLHWTWSFGDGTGSNLQNPHHIYPGPGTYTVTLTISGNGCQSTYNMTITIGGGTGCTATWVFYQDTNAVNSYHFICTNPANIYQYLWDFGDGSTATTMDPHHTFAQSGVYNVCLTISSFTCQDTYCDSIFVGTNPNPCSNTITFSVQGNAVHFIGNAIGGIAPYTYLWNFGDGTTATTHDPLHTYANAGTYTVTLTTTDSNGCTFTSYAIVVIQLPAFVNIYGSVWAGNNLLDFGWAYLYYGAQGTILTLIDSAHIDSLGMYVFGNMAPIAGHFYVKAVPESNSVYFNDYLPTYYGHTLFWANATPIIATQLNNPYNIELIPASPAPQGFGNITGQVTSDGKSLLPNGIPTPDIEVLLLNTSNQPMGIEYSDDQGNFTFSSLGYGTYKLYAEVTGLTTNPLIVTLNTSNPSVNNASIIITPTGVITGINEPVKDVLGLQKLYPNPASDIAYLDLALNKSNILDINVFNLIGEKLISFSREFSSGSHQLAIRVEDLTPGTYMLQIKSQDGQYYMHKISIIK